MISQSTFERDVATDLSVSLVKLRAMAKRGFVDLARIAKTSASYPDALRQVEQSLAKLRWLAVVSADNWNRLALAGLSYTVFASSRKTTAELIWPGNEILFYVTRIGRVAALAEVMSRSRTANVVWPGGVYSLKIALRPLLVLKPSSGARLRDLVPELTFMKNKEQWESYIRSAITLLPGRDFSRVKRALEVASSQEGLIQASANGSLERA